MAQGKAWDKEKVIESLKPYFLLGYSRNKACELAQFDPTCLQKWIDKDPELSIKIKAWQGAVNSKARQNVADGVQKGSKEDAKWWLERRERKSFATRTDHTTDDKPLSIGGLLEALNGTTKPKG